MSNSTTETVKIVKSFANKQIAIEDTVIIEQPILIKVEKVTEFKLLCTPSDLKNLVVGCLFAENIIESYADIITIKNADNTFFVQIKNPDSVITKRKLLAKKNSLHTKISLIENIRDSKPSAKLFSAIQTKNIIALINSLTQMQQNFSLTGATHAALIFNQSGKILAFAEDIGRHNALDKVIGKLLIEGKSIQGNGVALSSRVSFEMACKAIKAGIEIIAAISAPSSLAIDAAKYWNTTLCGFVRNNKLNIYTAGERIKEL